MSLSHDTRVIYACFRRLAPGASCCMTVPGAWRLLPGDWWLVHGAWCVVSGDCCYETADNGDKSYDDDDYDEC